jgi:hypothetical protein
MIDPSELPPEIQHLIEKREGGDRRSKQQRESEERRQIDLGPLGAIKPDQDLDELALEERRSGGERREQDRRQKNRRRSNPPDAE